MPSSDVSINYGQDAEDFTDFPTCGTHQVLGRHELEWLHGELQFEETNLHSKYLIVPEGIKDACDVLAVMCSLWGLSIPELFLVFDGGQDTDSGMLANTLDQDVWYGGTTDGSRAAEVNFHESLVKASKGIATACHEANAWVYGFDGSYGSADGDDMWGTCFNTAWSYFGQGRRSSSASRSVEFICAKGLRGLFGERKFRRHAVSLSQAPEAVVHYPTVSHRLQKDGKTVPDCVEAASGRMNRPERSQMIWPEFTHVVLFDGDSCRYPFPDIYKTMKLLTSTVHVVIGGVHPTLTNSVVEEVQSENIPVVLLKNTGGTADVISKAIENRQKKISDKISVAYTQSADHYLQEHPEWKQLQWSAMHPTAVQWSLPQSVKETNFVVVDVKRDSVMNVVDKILRVHAYTDDLETRQLGAAALEHDRLQEAWKSLVCYKYNAGNFAFSNSMYTYTIMALTQLTVMCAILKILITYVDTDNQFLPLLTRHIAPAWGAWMINEWSLSIPLVILPLLSGFFLSCLSRFSPNHKWGQLINASNMIKTEIYRYRARVGDYARRRGSPLDTAERIRRMPTVRRELLCRKQQMGSTCSTRVSSACVTPRGGGYEKSESSPSIEISKIDFSSLDPSKEPLLQDEIAFKRPKRRVHRTRRGAFQNRMEQIHTELGKGDVRLSSLVEPSQRAIRNERLSLTGAQDILSLEFFGEDFHPNKEHDKVLGNTADDGFSTIAAGDYVRFRVQPAIADLSRLAQSHGRALFLLETLRYLATMTCAMVAVLKFFVLIPIVVAFIGLITNISDFHQFSARMQSVNAGLTDLRNLLIWWESLDGRERRGQQVLTHLVDVTEHATYSDILYTRKAHQRPGRGSDEVELISIDKGEPDSD